MGLCIALLLIIFIMSFYVIFSRPSIPSNPTEYIYDFKLSQVENVIAEKFCCKKYHGLFFERQDTNNNIFRLGFMNFEKCGKSQVYYNFWGSLDLYAEFSIELDSIGPFKTHIKVTSDEWVAAGLNYDTNHGFPYPIRNQIKVPSTTFEEYQIISTLGKELGQREMPPLQNVVTER